MANPSQTTARSLRIDPEEVKRRLDSGESMTVLDVRAPKAWESSDVKFRGAIRVDPQHLRIDPSWPKNQLTVVY